MIVKRFQLRLLAVALLAWLMAPGAVVAAQNCAGGGGPRPDDGGIGGTGVQDDRPDDEGGIGGTGIGATVDTGVIGTITGFASICVGELEIHYGANTPIEIDGQKATASALAVGQVVEVVARGSGAAVRAQRISAQYIVSGPVTAVDSAGGSIEVLRQRIQLSDATRLDLAADGEPVAVSNLTPTTRLQVSGMRRADGVIVASRLSAAGGDERVRLSGAVSRADGGGLEVAGVAVRGEAQMRLSPGNEVRVVGRWDGQAIVAESVDALAAIPFGGHAARLDLEGFARPAASSGGVYVGPFLVEVPNDVAASSTSSLKAQDVRLHVQAVVHGSHVVAERVAVAAELPVVPAPDRPPGRSHAQDPVEAARQENHGPGGENAMHHGPDAAGAPNPGADRGSGPGGMIAPPGGAMPPRADRQELPGNGLPDRPMFERPGMPDRPQRPEPPPRPELPPRPDRPGPHGH